MTYALELGHWGMCGDSYSLISATIIGYYPTREAAWDGLYYIAFETRVDPVELLVRKPDFSVGEGGYPSQWDDPPDLERYRRMFEDWHAQFRPQR